MGASAQGSRDGAAPRAKAWSFRQVAAIAVQSAKVDLACALAAVVVSSGTNLAFPKLVGWMIDLVARDEGGPRGKAALQGAMLSMGVFALGAIGSVARVYFLEMGAVKIARRVRKDLYGSVLRGDPSAADSTAVVTSLSKDAEDLAKAICKNMAGVYRGCNSAFGGTAMLLHISPQLTMVSLAMLPLIGTGAMSFSKFSRGQAKRLKDATEQAISAAGERVDHLSTVQLFRNEDYELAEFVSALDGLQSAARRAALAEGAFMGGLSLSLNSSLLAVVLYGGSLVRGGAITAGQLASFGLYSGLVGLGFSQLSSSFADFHRVLGTSQRVKELLEAPAEGRADEGRATLPAGPARIELEGVHFAYQRKGTPVLRGLSMELQPGKVYALAGKSGEGKTTTLELLCRVSGRDDWGGRILWNGVDIRTTAIEDYRARISLVNQTPALFTGRSMSENIHYSDRSAAQAAVEAAARRAGAHDFISAMPRGYSTVLGSSEQAQLSVGQVHRIALARAFLCADRAQLWCFDESTAALDHESEQHVLAAFSWLASQGKTVLVVAHRLSTLQAADTILVLRDGVVCESGTLAELRARPDVAAQDQDASNDDSGLVKRLLGADDV